MGVGEAWPIGWDRTACTVLGSETPPRLTLPVRAGRRLPSRGSTQPFSIWRKRDKPSYDCFMNAQWHRRGATLESPRFRLTAVIFTAPLLLVFAVMPLFGTTCTRNCHADCGCCDAALRDNARNDCVENVNLASVERPSSILTGQDVTLVEIRSEPPTPCGLPVSASSLSGASQRSHLFLLFAALLI